MSVILMMLSMLTSMMFMFMKHPLSMGMTLLMQTTLVAMITGLFSYNYWYSYILFLIMVGGMLVLFIYMTSIASNEMFKYSNKMLMLMTIMMTLIIMMYFFMDHSLTTMGHLSNEMIFMNKSSSFIFSLNKFLNLPSSMVLLFLIMYLFITLIAVVKITNIKYGPLRQKL
uniref:NADH-ubiquinone oxidoreductase chain 6 n=1 Tax=Dryops ernesti TaxID=1553287 RepID=A0A343A437_9COLE|nr:NADH dehydrogenase subunit 6 [Dryops ernesti]AOY39315.1 NADH dehydrogenase subunit 6 [Dryops ernesti]